MQALLWPIVTWLLRTVILKFLVLTSIFLVIAFFVPYAIQYLGSFINVDGLSGAFSGLPAGVWFFIDFCRVGFGLPLIISAMISRFLIRRLPVIG